MCPHPLNAEHRKVWCVTLVAAVLVLVARTGKPLHALIAFVSMLLFLFLDSYYLALGSSLHQIPERVRIGDTSIPVMKCTGGEQSEAHGWVIPPCCSSILPNARRNRLNGVATALLNESPAVTPPTVTQTGPSVSASAISTASTAGGITTRNIVRLSIPGPRRRRCRVLAVQAMDCERKSAHTTPTTESAGNGNRKTSSVPLGSTIRISK